MKKNILSVLTMCMIFTSFALLNSCGSDDSESGGGGNNGKTPEKTSLSAPDSFTISEEETGTDLMSKIKVVVEPIPEDEAEDIEYGLAYKIFDCSSYTESEAFSNCNFSVEVNGGNKYQILVYAQKKGDATTRVLSSESSKKTIQLNAVDIGITATSLTKRITNKYEWEFVKPSAYKIDFSSYLGCLSKPKIFLGTWFSNKQLAYLCEKNIIKPNADKKVLGYLYSFPSDTLVAVPASMTDCADVEDKYLFNNCVYLYLEEDINVLTKKQDGKKVALCFWVNE